jgi:hypothetical protein
MHVLVACGLFVASSASAMRPVDDPEDPRLAQGDEREAHAVVALTEEMRALLHRAAERPTAEVEMRDAGDVIVGYDAHGRETLLVTGGNRVGDGRITFEGSMLLSWTSRVAELSDGDQEITTKYLGKYTRVVRVRPDGSVRFQTSTLPAEYDEALRNHSKFEELAQQMDAALRQPHFYISTTRSQECRMIKGVALAGLVAAFYAPPLGLALEAWALMADMLHCT